jgi:hypothetical protein
MGWFTRAPRPPTATELLCRSLVETPWEWTPTTFEDKSGAKLCELRHPHGASVVWNQVYDAYGHCPPEIWVGSYAPNGALSTVRKLNCENDGCELWALWAALREHPMARATKQPPAAFLPVAAEVG